MYINAEWFKFKKDKIVYAWCLRFHGNQSLSLSRHYAPSDKSSDFWKNLSNFPNVARSWVIPLPVSDLISERWLRLRGAAHSSDRTAADIDVNELRMCTRCCHGPITCLLLLCLKQNYIIWPFFLLSSFFLLILLMHLYYSILTVTHRALVHSSFWTPLGSFTGLHLRDCTWLYLLIHNNKLN